MATSMVGESATTKAELVEMSLESVEGGLCTLFGWHVDGTVLAAHVGVMAMIVMMLTMMMATTTTAMTTVTVRIMRMMMRKKEGERKGETKNPKKERKKERRNRSCLCFHFWHGYKPICNSLICLPSLCVRPFAGANLCGASLVTGRSLGFLPHGI